MGQRADELRRRISEFAAAVLRLVRRLPRDVATDSVVRQIARAAGSVAANYRAACCARTRSEFVAKLGVAVEEADETRHWLWMAEQLKLANGKDFDALTAESREIQAILSASLSTARRNLRRDGEAQQTARRPPPR